MSRQVRHRVIALGLGGFLLGATLLTTGTANAEQVAVGGRQVVFAGGGLLGLSCTSTPSVESLTVTADKTVEVVNRTGHTARLLIDGDAGASIPDDGSTAVTFRRGTTAIALDPSCVIAEESTPVLVTATPSVPPQPEPNPGPSSGDPEPSSPAATSPESTPPTSDSSSTAPGGESSAPTVTTPPTHTTRPTHNSPVPVRTTTTAVQAATTAAQAMPQGGTGMRDTTDSTGTPPAALPAFSGMPPGDDKTLLSGVLPVEVPETTTPAAPAAMAGPAPGNVAAEPLAAMRPMPESRPIGLLALIACVCVVGVAVGAIRAFVSERASRTLLA